MRLKTLLIMIYIVEICFSQNINIRGRVIDSAGSNLEGAVVYLEKYGYKDTTGGDGSFTLTGAVGINSHQYQPFPIKISASIKNKTLYIGVFERTTLEIQTYNIQGKIISEVKRTVNSGMHLIPLPSRSSGVYFNKIKTSKNEFVLKSNVLGPTSYGSVIFPSVPSLINISKKPYYNSKIEDVLRITKLGYLNERIAVTNSDTSGIIIKLISQDAGTVTDFDGNVYSTIRIGNQIWTVENLRVTHYNDGTPIPQIADNTAWSKTKFGSYCYYNNDSITNADKYGALYNWHAIYQGKLAPADWHVPTDAEWDTLESYLICNGYNWDGTTSGNKIGKSLAAKTDWITSDTQGQVGNDLSSNNSSGFSALPGGWRYYDGDFIFQSSISLWWCAPVSGVSRAYYRGLRYNEGCIDRNHHNRECGFSVRLVRD